MFKTTTLYLHGIKYQENKFSEPKFDFSECILHVVSIVKAEPQDGQNQVENNVGHFNDNVHDTSHDLEQGL